MKAQLKKLMVHYRREFKGQPEVQGTLALGADDYQMFPLLKKQGFDFIEVQRKPSGKLQVLFI